MSANACSSFFRLLCAIKLAILVLRFRADSVLPFRLPPVRRERLKAGVLTTGFGGRKSVLGRQVPSLFTSLGSRFCGGGVGGTYSSLSSGEVTVAGCNRLLRLRLLV